MTTMKTYSIESVNKARRFVNKVPFSFVDNALKRVNNVNKAVNKKRGALLTTICKRISALTHLSTMSTKKMVKTYIAILYMYSVHNWRATRTRA